VKIVSNRLTRWSTQIIVFVDESLFRIIGLEVEPQVRRSIKIITDPFSCAGGSG